MQGAFETDPGASHWNGQFPDSAQPTFSFTRRAARHAPPPPPTTATHATAIAAANAAAAADGGLAPGDSAGGAGPAAKFDLDAFPVLGNRGWARPSATPLASPVSPGSEPSSPFSLGEMRCVTQKEQGK